MEADSESVAEVPGILNAGHVTVAAAPVIIRTVLKAVRQRRQVRTGYQKARVEVASWLVRKGQAVGCDAEEKL